MEVIPIRKTVLIFLIIVTALLIFAGGFPEDLDFSLPGENQEMANLNGGSDGQEYWYHDTPLKIFFVAVFTTAGFIIIWTKKLVFRKPLLIASTIVQGFLLGAYLCPSRAVQNVILKYDTAYLIMFLVPIVTTFLFGRVYCGYACPFGAVQELLHVKRLRYKLPIKLDGLLRYIKYVLLVLAVSLTVATGRIVGGDAPFKPLFIFSGTLVAILMTVAFGILSVFVYRPFCSYLCPYGALMSLVSKFRLIRIKREETCVDCKLCVKKCPVGAMKEPGLGSGECIMCGDCCEVCPKDSLNVCYGGVDK